MTFFMSIGPAIASKVAMTVSKVANINYTLKALRSTQGKLSVFKSSVNVVFVRR